MSLSVQRKPAEDHLLWEELRKGDDQALAVLFRRHYALLYNYGMKFCGQSELVKDSIQEIFAYIWEKRGTISGVQSVRAYLLVALRRQLLKTIRQQHRRLDTQQQFGYSQDGNTSSAEDIMILHEEKDAEKKALHEALNQIPTRMREALYLKTFDTLSYKEIAAIMNVSTQVARNYVSQAFHRLRTILAVASVFLLLLF